MKIVYIIEELCGGGKERRLVELLRGLNKVNNFELHLIVAKTNNYYPEVDELPITIHYLKAFSNLALIRQYYLILKRIKPDIVHTWSFKTSIYAAILKSLLNYTLIAGFISNTFGHSKKLEILSDLLIYRQSDKVVSNSKAGLIAYKVPDNKGYVINNGFDLQRLGKRNNAKQLLKALGINSNFTVIMVANVTPKKGDETFIKVALTVTRQHRDVTFLSIGIIRKEFNKMVLPYIDNKHNKIKFIGFNKKAVDIIQECDIGVLCSEREGISNSIIEYMAAGLPVVTTDLKGASSELLTNNVHGFICNKQEVSNKLVLLLNDKSLRSQIGNNNSERIKKRFSIEAMTTKHSAMYKQLYKTKII